MGRIRTWLAEAWDRLGELGIKDGSTGERRRIRLTNHGSALGALNCGAFGAGYAIADARAYWVPMMANFVAVGLFLCAPLLNLAGRALLARCFLLIPSHAVVVVASMLLGGRVGFVYYFFVLAVFAFLLFPTDFKLARAAFASLSVACIVFVRVVAPSDEEVMVRISSSAARALDIASALAVVVTVLLIVHLFTSDTEVAETRLAAEHGRSERLLLNILPESISTRLKSDDEAIADGFAEVSVLFADIVGFTELSQRLSPAELVQMLNRIFSAFDDLAAELGLEKIKTIGDAYMVACGLPHARADHAKATATMALEMLRVLSEINASEGYGLSVRIGMHAGPVVAGVIGKRKFIYDLWGDTVNTASRMESSGSAGQIQVTSAMRDLLAADFEFERRGVVVVKGKGEMETHWLRGLAKTGGGSTGAEVVGESAS